MPGEKTRYAVGVRALLLVAVLLLGALIPAGVPTVGAQTVNPPQPNPQPISFDRNPAVYYEGESVQISVTPTSNSEVLDVKCQSGCPAMETQVYEAPIPGNPKLTFPSPEFCQVVNAVRDCVNYPNAQELLEPRFNGTWVASLTLGPGGAPVYQATFTVSMTNAWAYNYTLQPTLYVLAGAGGFVPNSAVTMVFGRKAPDGSEQGFLTYNLRASSTGQVGGFWFIGKSEAQYLQTPCQGGPSSGPTCNPALDSCAYCKDYFVSVTASASQGNTKTSETVWYYVKPATLTPHNLGKVDSTYERTQKASWTFQLQYPDNEFATSADFPKASGPGSLTVAVLRMDPSTHLPLGYVTNLTAKLEFFGIFTVNWTIPKNISLPKTTNGVPDVYEFQVNPTEDAAGNMVPATGSQLFNVTVAALQATFIHPPLTAERAQKINWTLRPRYYDGEEFNATENATQLTGNVQVLNSQAGIYTNIQNGAITAVPGKNGTWIFRYEFPKGYSALATHQFQFTGCLTGGADKWGNYIMANTSPSLPVTTAKFSIQLSAQSDGNFLTAATGWARDDAITFHALIQYPDGSAFNASVNAQHNLLNATLTKRLGSTFIEVDPVQFTPDGTFGSWVGHYTVPLSDSGAPLGTWTLDFPLYDRQSPQNGEDVPYNWTMNAANISVTPGPISNPNLSLGDTETWGFALRYPDGSHVAPADMSRVGVSVYRWSGERVLALQVPFSQATFDPYTNEWSVSWLPPNGTALSQYTFLVQGQDRFGNPVQSIHSAIFSLSAPTQPRDVIDQPRAVVARNETVTVTFDNLPGDTGENGTGNPRIVVERWSAPENEWVVELENVYAGNSGPGTEHVGVWITNAHSTLGLYRFHLYGADSNHAYIEGISHTFTLEPLNVSVPVIAEPAANVTKETSVSFSIAADYRDAFGHASLMAGATPVGSPRFSQSGRNWTFTWTPSYQDPAGAYTMEVFGTDPYGNAIEVDSTPFNVLPTTIAEQTLDAPPSIVSRGAPTTITFRTILPNGLLADARYGYPKVRVTGPGGFITEVGSTFAQPDYGATFTIPLTAPLGIYNVTLYGPGADGNQYAQIQAANFTLAPGFIERPFQRNPDFINRLGTFSGLALSNTTDQAMGCFVDYYGSDSDARQLVSKFNATFSPSPGRYDVSWRTAIDTPLGFYRLECDGRDTYGNSIRIQSGFASVSNTPIQSTIDAGTAPKQDALKGGAVLRWRFYFYYADGRRLTPSMGTPDPGVTFDGQLVGVKPTLTYDAASRYWIFTWVAPQDLPAGVYVLGVQGADAFGNPIVAVELGHFDLQVSTSEKLFGIPGVAGFNSVPGPEPAIVLFGILGAAMLLARMRRR
ncbi:MAG: hypothetical protein ACYDDF_04270 [Thermoplasmatota archaeon]